MRIRAALPLEAALLTKLVMAAKAQWGYGDSQLEIWRQSLAVTEEQLVTQPAFVAEDHSVVGFYSLKLSNGACELDNLWVVPSEMGRGCGAALLAHAATVAKSMGFAQISIDADPHAEAFYIRCGAIVIGKVPAPIDGQPDRVRPQLRLSSEVTDWPTRG